MEEIRLIGLHPGWLKSLTADCDNCCGLCCTALCFSKTEGFPADKEAGKPCVNLTSEFRCGIHAELAKQKLKGCMAYDCLGAGQKVTQAVYGGLDWKALNEAAGQMFQVFLTVYRLHQMLWYLREASSIICAQPLYGEINALINENNELTRLSPDKILKTDIGTYKLKVDTILKKAGGLVQMAVNGSAASRHATDFFGKDFKRTDLSGKDFSLSLLIAADLRGCNLYGVNFLGADMRDANLDDTDLSQSVFLTQMQVNSARGNRGTKLPPALFKPTSWAN
ncbi:MAG: pentapeptide repeat-containing protein [Oscillospiraceae bacterium]